MDITISVYLHVPHAWDMRIVLAIGPTYHVPPLE